MRLKMLLTGASFALASVAAQAQTYAEVGVLAGGYEEDVFGMMVKSSPKALRAIIGREISENVAIEGLLGLGVGGGGLKVDGVKVPDSDLKFKSILGVYLKGKVNVTNGLDVFARAGLSRVEATVTVGSAKASGRDSDFSYGLGVSYALNKVTSLTFDYMNFMDKSGGKMTGFTMGVGYKF